MGLNLLDERTRPDFREVYGRLASGSATLDAAVNRVRLGGMDLGERELGALRRIRLLTGEMNALTIWWEAEALAADPRRRGRLDLLGSLLRSERLEIRLAPLAGWHPDFTVFTPPERDERESVPEAAARTLMIGLHWFERPYPHPGPALGAVMGGPPAERAFRRFEELWERAHDIHLPIVSILADALLKSATRVSR